MRRGKIPLIRNGSNNFRPTLLSLFSVSLTITTYSYDRPLLPLPRSLFSLQCQIGMPFCWKSRVGFFYFLSCTFFTEWKCFENWNNLKIDKSGFTYSTKDDTSYCILLAAIKYCIQDFRYSQLFKKLNPISILCKHWLLY